MVIHSDKFQFVSAHCEIGKAPDKILKTLLPEEETHDRLSQAVSLKHVHIKATGLSRFTCDIHTHTCVC